MLPKGHGSEEFYLLELTTYTLVTWLGRGVGIWIFFFEKKDGVRKPFWFGWRCRFNIMFLEPGDVLYFGSKTRSFPIKTRVIWVSGLYMFGWVGWVGLVGWCLHFSWWRITTSCLFGLFNCCRKRRTSEHVVIFSRTSALKFEKTPWMFNVDPEHLPSPKGKLGGGFMFLYFRPYLGKWSNLTCAYFSKGLKPPTRKGVFQFHHFSGVNSWTFNFAGGGISWFLLPRTWVWYPVDGSDFRRSPPFGWC